MWKGIIKKLLEDMKMLQVNFVMIYIIYKILVLHKITRVLQPFLRNIIDLQKVFKNLFKK